MLEKIIIVDNRKDLAVFHQKKLFFISAVKSQEDTDRKKTYNKNTYKKHFINMKPHRLSKKLEKKNES